MGNLFTEIRDGETLSENLETLLYMFEANFRNADGSPRSIGNINSVGIVNTAARQNKWEDAPIQNIALTDFDEPAIMKLWDKFLAAISDIDKVLDAIDEKGMTRYFNLYNTPHFLHEAWQQNELKLYAEEGVSPETATVVVKDNLTWVGAVAKNYVDRLYDIAIDILGWM